MRTIHNKLLNILSFFIGIALVILTVVTLLQVISRYLLPLPIPWSTDIIRISFVYMIFLAMPILMKDNEHISIDVLLSILPKKIRDIFELFGLLFVLFFSIIFTYSSVIIMVNSGTQTMPYINLLFSYVYAAMPISGVLLIFYTVLLIIKKCKSGICK